jgi:mono/diheme cytochrome c family protein
MRQPSSRHYFESFARLALVAAAIVGLSVRAEAQQSPVERGRYLVGITGCHDCHSPKVKGMEPDMARALSGRPSTTPLPTDAKDEVHSSLDLTAWKGPWGFSVASNLTPDGATGIGTRYNEASFLTTMRTGKKPNGTPIMPPMPSDVYKNMTDDDLKAIFAYLKTIKPIRNAVFAGLQIPGAKPPAGTKK